MKETIIAANLALIRKQIAEYERKYQRPENSVVLLAVTKTRPVEEIVAASECNQMAYGESFVQEAIPKINFFKNAVKNTNITWHYIGKVQSNKTKLIAQNFSWVQSITKEEYAVLLNKHRSETSSKLNICIEVNISNENTKGGVSLPNVLPLAEAITKLPNLALRGLMAIPAPGKNFSEQYETFSLLAEEFHKLNAAGFGLDTLSMGMSGDFEAAIAAGSTMVRIGTAVFGERM
jgi:PLP dependent protein